ncbi:MAG: hypothetical protein FJ312_09710 [SAR202 cluster bacterium]|nr:hypothetical protein [SAR202 cluster bacterium]
MALHGLDRRIAAASVASETASNTPSASIAVPVIISLARSAGVAPFIPALGATMGASMGFVFPVSTPLNALIYGTGHVRLLHMVRNGLLLDLLGGFPLWAYLVLLVS